MQPRICARTTARATQLLQPTSCGSWQRPRVCITTCSFTSLPYYAAPQYPLNITVYELGSSEWQVVNEQCRVMGSGFSDWFSWVSLSTFSKTVEVAGRMCDEFDLPSGDLVLHMDVEQGTNIPVQYYITQGSSLLIGYLFGADLTEEFSNSAFNLTKLCTINDGHGFYCTSRSQHHARWNRCRADVRCRRPGPGH